MNILHLRASNFYGGPERQLHFHAKHASKNGINLIIASFSESGNIPDFLRTIENDSIPIKLFQVKNAYDFSVVSQLKSYLIKYKIDILCTHDYRTHFYGMLARNKRNTAWIAFSRGWTNENLKIQFFCAMDKIIIRMADKIVAVSDSQKKKLTDISISAAKIATVHNAIDIEFLTSIKQQSLRERFQFTQENFICISGGRFSEEKGQLHLVKAAEQAIKANHAIRFVLFGDGPDLDTINKYIHSRNLQDKIICPGFENNLLGYLKDADLLVNPSLSEGLPNIVLEAMASEIPVIATNIGGHPELIQNNDNGILVPVADSNKLADAIIRLANDKELCNSFKQNGRQTIIDTFNFTIQNKKLIDIYNLCLQSMR